MDPGPAVDPVAPGRAVPHLRRARWATAVAFAVHGAVTGTFAARVPWLAAHVGVGVGVGPARDGRAAHPGAGHGCTMPC